MIPVQQFPDLGRRAAEVTRELNLSVADGGNFGESSRKICLHHVAHRVKLESDALDFFAGQKKLACDCIAARDADRGESERREKAAAGLHLFVSSSGLSDQCR